MKIEKAMEILENINSHDYTGHEFVYLTGDDAREMSNLFKQLIKYKQIVEDIKQYIIDRQTIEEDFATNGNEIIDLIKWLKRKYFPKDNKEELIERIRKITKIINENGITLEEFNKAFTPKL